MNGISKAMRRKEQQNTICRGTRTIDGGYVRRAGRSGLTKLDCVMPMRSDSGVHLTAKFSIEPGHPRRARPPWCLPNSPSHLERLSRVLKMVPAGTQRRTPGKSPITFTV